MQRLGIDMLTEDRIVERSDAPMFFNPGSFNSWRDLPIFTSTWKYRWEGDTVDIQDDKGNTFTAPTWAVLEVGEREYREWAAEPGGIIVSVKDVADYVKENILRKAMARRFAGRFSN